MSLLTAEQIEGFAIRAALGNNGGAWAEHYTDEQKEHWRRFVVDIESELRTAQHSAIDALIAEARADIASGDVIDADPSDIP